MDADWIAEALGDMVKELKAENERLRAFACYVMCNSFNGLDTDGGEAQDKAESLGLLELRPIDPEDSIDGETEHYFLVWAPKVSEERMTPERLDELERKAYGKGGERVHYPELMEGCLEIRRAWVENERLKKQILGMMSMSPEDVANSKIDSGKTIDEVFDDVDDPK